MSRNDTRCSRKFASAWGPSVGTGTTNSGFPDMLDLQLFGERETALPSRSVLLHCHTSLPVGIRGQPTQHRRGLRIEDRGSNVLALFLCLRSSILHRPC